MRNPAPIFTYRDGLERTDARASVLLVALGGFVDAGHTQRLLAAHILARHEHELVASFDVDQLIDYRGRRPGMLFETERYVGYDAPTIDMHLVRDRSNKAFLLLNGVEPDYQWERVIEGVASIIDDLGVQLTVLAHGVPMGVPHTRPLGYTAHATDPALIAGTRCTFQKMLVPGSIESLLEFRLGERGCNVLAYAVHVPNYLAQLAIPAASLTALDRITAATGLNLDRSDLAAGSKLAEAKIAEQLAARPDVQQMVSGLEEQYDAAHQDEPSEVADDEVAEAPNRLPTADDIGAEAEAFLRGLEPPDGDGADSEQAGGAATTSRSDTSEPRNISNVDDDEPHEECA